MAKAITEARTVAAQREAAYQRGIEAEAEQARLRTKYPCCGGSGWVRARLSDAEAAEYGTDEPPVGHLLFGRIVPCNECTSYAKIVATRLDHISVLPNDLRFLHATWATFPPQTDRDALKSMQSYTKGIINGKMQKRGVVLRGKNQIGKTGMAYCVHQDLRIAQVPSIFLRAVDLLERLRIAKLDNEDHARYIALMDDFAAITHLVIDDLGADKSTEFSEQVWYDLLDRRIKDPKLFTTITTNLQGDDLREKLGDRPYSRIATNREDIYQIVVKGEMNAIKSNGGVE